ncbi:MAG: hypothetical protein ACKVOB_05065 [Sphingomonas sp.]
MGNPTEASSAEPATPITTAMTATISAVERPHGQAIATISDVAVPDPFCAIIVVR